MTGLSDKTNVPLGWMLSLFITCTSAIGWGFNVKATADRALETSQQTALDQKEARGREETRSKETESLRIELVAVKAELIGTKQELSRVASALERMEAFRLRRSQ